MPLVRVRYSLEHEGHVLRPKVLEGLGESIRIAVAMHLSCRQGELVPDDIEVFFEEASPYDVSGYQVMIDVEAMYYPQRDKGDDKLGENNFASRVSNLRDDLHQMLPMHVGFGLWVKLVNAQWADRAASAHGLGDLLENADPGDDFPGHAVAHGLHEPA